MEKEEIKNFVNSEIEKHAFFSKSSMAYREKFILALEAMSEMLSPKELDIFLKNKLQFLNYSDRKMVIQSLCELTIGFYLARKFRTQAAYEVKVDTGSKKDFDYQLKLDGFNVNLEIKCPRYDKQEEVIDKGGLHLEFWGRVPNFQNEYHDLRKSILEGQKKQNLREIKDLFLGKHMDYNVYESLVYTHNKVGSANTPQAYNVLILGCNDPSDLNKVLGYLIGHQGLFNKDSFSAHEEYSSVDAVLLTNMYYKHNSDKFLENGDSLFFEKTFSVIHCNSFAAIPKQDCFLAFKENFHHYTDQLIEFSKTNYAPNEIKPPLLMSSFISSNPKYEKLF